MMLSGCPSLVIPVLCNTAPVLAWDCKPLKELWKLKDEELECHARNVVEYLHSLVDYDHVELPARMIGKISLKAFLGNAVRKIIQMAVLISESWSRIRQSSKKRFTSDHTGIVFLRYTNASSFQVKNRKEGCYAPALPAIMTTTLKRSLTAPGALATQLSDLTLNVDEQGSAFQMNTPGCPKMPITVFVDGTTAPPPLPPRPKTVSSPLFMGNLTVPASVEHIATSPVQEETTPPAYAYASEGPMLPYVYPSIPEPIKTKPQIAPVCLGTGGPPLPARPVPPQVLITPAGLPTPISPPLRKARSAYFE
ncbi:hypothetical protein BC832DRAFT_550972 [Gaertneriomyces semiglobifer]|nr:hypothetical protein BC832DRAFT_550972 [Gaertneriomyces semiglobifer]